MDTGLWNKQHFFGRRNTSNVTICEPVYGHIYGFSERMHSTGQNIHSFWSVEYIYTHMYMFIHLHTHLFTHWCVFCWKAPLKMFFLVFFFSTCKYSSSNVPVNTYVIAKTNQKTVKTCISGLFLSSMKPKRRFLYCLTLSCNIVSLPKMQKIYSTLVWHK